MLVHRDAGCWPGPPRPGWSPGWSTSSPRAGSASVVLTGGGIGIADAGRAGATPPRATPSTGTGSTCGGATSGSCPSGHPDRNETQAREALLDHVPVDPARVHADARAGRPDGDDPEAAAARYAAELADATTHEDHGPVPAFDVLLLGVGAGRACRVAVPRARRRSTTTGPSSRVHGAPKPPPTRLTMTLRAINAAREVWVVVAGAEKAGAVAMALWRRRIGAGAGGGRRRAQTHAVAARHGRRRGIPAGLTRIASP